MSKTPPVPPFLALFFGIFAISVSAILIRFAQGDDVPSLVIAAWRLTLATLILLPIAWRQQRAELKGLTSAEIIPAILSGIMLAIHFGTWISSLAYTSIAASSVFVATSPLWVAIAAPLVLQERLGRKGCTGVALALIGSTVIGVSDLLGGQGSGSNPLLGNLLALMGGLSAAAYLLIGRRLRIKLSLVSYITIVYGIAATTLMFVALASGYAIFAYPPQIFALFLLMAIFPQLLGHTSVNYALGYLSAAYVTVAMISEPIGASILALFVLSERPTIFTVIGAMLIICGIFLTSRDTAAA